MAISFRFGGRKVHIRSPLSVKDWNFVPSGIGGTNTLSQAWLAAFGRDSQNIDTTTVDGQLTAYTTCPPVSTIISKKAQAFNRAEFTYSNDSGAERSQGYAGFIQKLLSNPNPFQSYQAFMTTAYTMNQLFGKTYFYAVKPMGMGFESIQELYVIPNDNVEVKDVSADRFKKPLTYSIQFQDKCYTIPAEFIYIWDDVNVDFISEITYMGGQSRLYPLSHVVTANASAYNANNTLLTNYGAIGIISSAKEVQGSTTPMTSDERA
jgi:hypothetical protein